MKALRTMLVILCVATLGVHVFDAPRAAAAGASLQIQPDPAKPGGSVDAIGVGFCASSCSLVTLRIGNETVAEHVRVDAGGRFSATFTAPFAAGSYTLRAIQMKGGATLGANADLTVATTDVNLSGPAAVAAPPTANSSPRTTTPPPTSPPAVSTTTVVGGPTTRPPTTTRPSTSTTRVPTSTTTAATEPSVPASTSSSTEAWPWVVLGLAVLVAAAVAGVLWYRARRRRKG